MIDRYAYMAYSKIQIWVNDSFFPFMVEGMFILISWLLSNHYSFSCSYNQVAYNFTLNFSSQCLRLTETKRLLVTIVELSTEKLMLLVTKRDVLLALCIVSSVPIVTSNFFVSVERRHCELKFNVNL